MAGQLIGVPVLRQFGLIQLQISALLRPRPEAILVELAEQLR
jgi:hypothetical protein